MLIFALPMVYMKDLCMYVCTYVCKDVRKDVCKDRVPQPTPELSREQELWS